EIPEIEIPRVCLPELPEQATGAMRRVAEFFSLVYALRLWAGRADDVPFACGWVAEKLGLHKTTAYRAIRDLCEAGGLIYTEAMPARGKKGTHKYLPGLLAVDDLLPPFADEVEVAEPAAASFESVGEVLDPLLVAGAEIHCEVVPRAAASGDGAGRLF